MAVERRLLNSYGFYQVALHYGRINGWNSGRHPVTRAAEVLAAEGILFVFTNKQIFLDSQHLGNEL